MFQVKDARVGDRVCTVVDDYRTRISRNRAGVIVDIYPHTNLLIVRFDDIDYDWPMLPAQIWPITEEVRNESAA